ncbi:Heat shock protein Hsp90 [Phytophthora cinnamomi]|uniref:Heat shock protein Hsp90 n=1 Tax=Phytophthora cinnamomi TaxID=4785 RepID=UPI00355A4196|nr:Heat shock protein Hsp90 [Phytophthora cinnamomi]
MQDGGLFMMSPMNAAGEERLRQARACIRQTFGPGGAGRRTKRSLDMPAAPPTPAKTPRTKMRQRITQASQLSAEQLFFQEFGSCDELLSTEFDLARPAGHPVPKTRRFGSGNAAVSMQTALYPAAQQTTAAPTTFFSASAFTSSLPAPSTANVSQLTRPSRIRTPRKAAIKRARAGESSAEKELVLRKPRLGGPTARSIDYSSSAGGSAFGAQAAPARKSLAFVTTRGEHLAPPTGPNRFYSRTSPSKFQFSSNATRLFSQRQAPLR